MDKYLDDESMEEIFGGGPLGIQDYHAEVI